MTEDTPKEQKLKIEDRCDFSNLMNRAPALSTSNGDMRISPPNIQSSKVDFKAINSELSNYISELTTDKEEPTQAISNDSFSEPDI